MGDDDRTLRITPPFFYVLLSLARGARHGYAIADEVEELSGGDIVMPPGSLYWSLGRLDEAGLIEQVERSSDDPHAERRKYYGLTDVGRERLRRHAEVLASALDRARARGVL